MAYGAFCLLDRTSGILTFVSYRDPNLLQTLDIFDRSARFLEEEILTDEELAKSIIGAIGDLDSHMLPDAKGFVSMIRYLTNDTERLRQQMREELLGTTADDFQKMGRVFEGCGGEGCGQSAGIFNRHGRGGERKAGLAQPLESALKTNFQDAEGPFFTNPLGLSQSRFC